MKKENNKKIGFIILGIVILAGMFCAGMAYGKSKPTYRGQGGAMGAFNRGGAGARAGGMEAMGGFTTGQIISKDDKSITVSLLGGGSKIIFLDGNTKIAKSAQGTVADLATGIQVSVTGTANADGSVNAQTVQIRPPMVK